MTVQAERPVPYSAARALASSVNAGITSRAKRRRLRGPVRSATRAAAVDQQIPDAGCLQIAQFRAISSGVPYIALFRLTALGSPSRDPARQASCRPE